MLQVLDPAGPHLHQKIHLHHRLCARAPSHHHADYICRICHQRCRFWTLLDPTYAKKYIPIIASVSEHQPTTWAAYVFDLHLLVFAAPAGMYFCFKKLTDANIFLLTFALTATYFSGIMVRWRIALLYNLLTHKTL